MSEAQRRFSHIIVVGASAGGIESLLVLASKLGEDFPAPIVVAQHLAPNRASALADILARRSRLRVQTIEDIQPLEAGVIYVVPPDRNVRVTDHELSLIDDDSSPQPSIDLLFRAASQVFGEDVIAVVLSGTGSDGAEGAREVKFAGGSVIIENPETAAFPGMPLSLARSSIDIVADRDRIADLLSQLISGEFVVPPASDQSQLRSFLDGLRDDSGIDFSAYKEPTIQRRLQRRLLATNQSSIAGYIRYVREHPEERRRLINSFLIKVTEFFRDPDVFHYLRTQVLPEMIGDAARRGGELRIWSAGCATGEEAYSLAMTVSDMMSEMGVDLHVRIFATDLDDEAVAYARRGIYPARALSALPPDMLARHFSEYGDDYEVRKPLRSLIVFGEHDLGQRAPFPRIDLIFCRNVLIYFTPALQRRTLQLFAFSLRSGGYLTLGKSETVSPLAEFFAVDQPRLKVYRRVGDRALIPPTPFRDSLSVPNSAARSMNVIAAPEPMRASRPSNPHRWGTWSADQLLAGLAVGVVLVDRNYDIHSINGEARRLFGIHSIAVEQDFIHQIQHFDAKPIRQVIDGAMAANEPGSVLVPSQDPPGDARRILEVTAIPTVRGGDDGDVFVALTAADVTEREQLRDGQAGAALVLHRLTQANEEVLMANQELTATITRLRAENEGLLVAAEEIQAATEEVETLNEELQASNEELETLNEELQATVEELNATNDDLQARTVELQTTALDGETVRQRLRAVLETLGYPTGVFDHGGTLVMWNGAWEDFDLPASFDLKAQDGNGFPVPANAWPPAHAMRAEPLDRVVGIDRPGHGRQWLRLQGSPVMTADRERLLVVTVKPAPDREG
jgi:two-component system CheB/CheR fusion protein